MSSARRSKGIQGIEMYEVKRKPLGCTPDLLLVFPASQRGRKATSWGPSLPGCPHKTRLLRSWSDVPARFVHYFHSLPLYFAGILGKLSSLCFNWIGIMRLRSNLFYSCTIGSWNWTPLNTSSFWLIPKLWKPSTSTYSRNRHSNG